jgi:hypothetical protein
LHPRRQVAMDICAISFNDIKAWAHMCGHQVTTFEVEALLAVDDAFMAFHKEAVAREAESKKPT